MARFGYDQTSIGHLDIHASDEGRKIDAYFIPIELPNEASAAHLRLDEDAMPLTRAIGGLAS